jgi:Predicted phosphohydrolases
MFRYLHFSDLHFNTKDTVGKQHAHDTLLTYLKEQKFATDFLFITGDIADKADYTEAKVFIPKLVDEIDINKDNIFWSVGNHDIKRTRTARNSLIEEIRKSTKGSDEFQKIMLDDDEGRPMLTNIGMTEYIKEYKNLFGRELSEKEIRNAHVLVKRDNINILVFNTCLTSFDNNDPYNLFLIDSILHKIINETDMDKPTIALGHHGYEFLNPSEADNLGILFDGKVDLYLCGH